MYQKLLNIPGGGVKGIISAQILERLTEMKDSSTGNELLATDEIYSFSGTSAGAIIASSLALGKSPGEIVEAYKELATEVFKVRRFLGFIPLPKFAWLATTGAPYDLKRLENILESQFKGKRLKDVPRRLVMVCWNIGGNVDNPNKRQAPLIVHNHETKMPIKHLLDCKLSSLVAASCAAPTFFAPKVINIRGSEYVLSDGGLVDVSSSLSNYLICRSPFYGRGLKAGEIVSLTVGNTDRDLHQKAESINAGWAAPKRFRSVIDSVCDSNSMMSDLSMRTLLGPRYHSIKIKGHNWQLDEADKIDDMQKAAQTADLSAAKSFLRGYFNVPIHPNHRATNAL